MKDFEDTCIDEGDRIRDTLTRLVSEVRSAIGAAGGAHGARREFELQLAAFEERCTEARRLAARAPAGVPTGLDGDLARIIDALQLSLAYFTRLRSAAPGYRHIEH